MLGGADDDLLQGDDGNDFLEGGDGNDVLEGGAGNDWLTGGEGDDLLSGGTGQDYYMFAVSGDGEDTIMGDKSSDHLRFGTDPTFVRTATLDTSDPSGETFRFETNSGREFTLPPAYILSKNYTGARPI